MAILKGEKKYEIEEKIQPCVTYDNQLFQWFKLMLRVMCYSFTKKLHIYTLMTSLRDAAYD